MSNPGIVIVGGGPAALSTARSYRDSGGDSRVEIVTLEPHPPYSRPPLTKEFLRGEMSAEELPMQDSGWYDDNDVHLKLATKAVSLDTSEKKLSLSDGTVSDYESCVIATGSRPLSPIPGMEDPGVCVVRTLEDSERLISAAKRARDYGDGTFVVIGSGFIGCETAASLAMIGLDVSLVTLEDAPQIERLGPDAAGWISSWLEDLGVKLHTGTGIRNIQREPSPTNIADGEMAFRVVLENGEYLRGCGIAAGTGNTPDTMLAENADIRVDSGIVCDSSMRTSTPDVYAAGDVALAENKSAARPLRVEHWGDALGQGKVCGEVLAGIESVWDEVPGFWSTIGQHTLKYAAWGDGWDETRFIPDGDSFTVWYGLRNECVGVLTCNNDKDYERGRLLVGESARMPV